MNIDTDTQWAYWEGIKNFYKKNEGYLQGQVIDVNLEKMFAKDKRPLLQMPFPYLSRIFWYIF